MTGQSRGGVDPEGVDPAPFDPAPFELGPALLFCPADRPDRFEKAALRADAVILDLEDAVAPENLDAARTAIRQHPLHPPLTIVRINARGTAAAAADIEMLLHTDYRLVMVPKAESAPALDALAGFGVIALCETAAGVLAASELARHPLTVALMWGAEDLVASLGGTSSRRADGRYRDVARHARSTVLLAAAAHGCAAIDAVHLDLTDSDIVVSDIAAPDSAASDITAPSILASDAPASDAPASDAPASDSAASDSAASDSAASGSLVEEATDAAACGFGAVACIHPGQVAAIRAAYRPAADEVMRARELLAAATGGVFRHGGRMIDGPVLAHARAVLRRADAGARPK